MGVYRLLDIRPSEVVVSTVVLLRSPCWPGLDWCRRMSTSDLPPPPAEKGGGQKDGVQKDEKGQERELSPGHVDVPVPRAARHLAEGDPYAHRHHQREGDHSSDHVGRAESRGEGVRD